MKSFNKMIFSILLLILFMNFSSAFSGSGAGTLANPYVITNWTTLNEVRNALTANYSLAANLSAADADYISNFVPIGNGTSSSTYFKGGFNGNNNTISNLTIILSGNNIGLFGYISNGNISNLGLINANISANIASSSAVGILFGYGSGRIDNCYSTGTVNSYTRSGGLAGYGSAVISNSYSRAIVYIAGDKGGGLIGESSGTISNSYSIGSLSVGWSGAAFSGGLVGLFSGAISNSYSSTNVTASGTYVGGLVGRMTSGSISNSYSTQNTVSGSSGGFVGYLDSGTISNSYSTSYLSGASGSGFVYSSAGTITNCYWDMNTSNKTSSAAGTGKNTTEMKEVVTFGDTWNISSNEAAANSYPYLSWQVGTNSYIWKINQTTFAGGSGTSGDPYQIDSWMQLNNTRDNLTSYFILTTNLSSSTSDYIGIGDSWIPVGNETGGYYFSGGFNGNSNNISNLIVSRSTVDYAGLFGYATGNISNVKLINANITGKQYVGGLAGYQTTGVISNSFVTGNVTGLGDEVGGLVGQQTTGTINNSYSAGKVVGANAVGGLAGRGDGTIGNCYSTSNVTGSGAIAGGLVGWKTAGAIINSFSTGVPAGTSSVGGLVGLSQGGTISNSYWDMNTSGQTTSSGAGAVGKTTLEMKNANTFSAWNMSSLLADLNNGYPYLGWQANNNSYAWMIPGTSTALCGTLGQENVTYTLTSNVSATGTCFTVTANNVTLDCNGYWINYGTTGTELGFGVYTTRQNYTTVKNCIINEGNTGTSYKYGVYFNTSTGSVLDNSTIKKGSATAYIRIFASSNTTIKNSVFNNLAGWAINIEDSPYTNVSRNNINFDASINAGAVYYLDSYYPFISSNLYKSTGNSFKGVQLENASFGTIYNNTLITTNNADTLYLASTNSTNISNNNITNPFTSTQESYAFRMSAGYFNNITNNYISGSSDYSNMYIYSSSNNNTIYNNTIYAVEGDGIYLGSASNNISANNITSLAGMGIRLVSGAASNTFDLNNITTSGTASYGIYSQVGTANYFSNGRINTIGGSGHGIVLSTAATGNTFSGMDIKTSSTGHGLYLSSANQNFTIKDSMINTTSASSFDFYIASAVPGGTWNFTNVTRADGTTSIEVNWSTGANGTLNNFWYANATVNYTNGSIAPGISVAAYDVNGNLYSSNTTDATGSSKLTLLEYKRNGTTGATITNYNNYTINATTSYYPETASVNMSTNRNVFFTVDVNSPTATIVSPQNNSYVNNATINFTANISDVGEGIKNATLNVVDTQNKWLNFDGDNDYANASSLNSYPNGKESLTLSGWVKYSRSSDNEHLFGWWWTADNNIVTSSDGISFHLKNNTKVASVTSASALNDNLWHFIVGTYNSSQVMLYVDGVAQGAGDTLSGVMVSPDVFTVGGLIAAGYTFNGSIDEVRVYNRSLTASEISALYNNRLTANATFGNTSGLVAYYDMQNSDGNITRLVDMSGNGNNGTIAGATWANSYSSTTTYGAGITTQVIGTVITLVDGIYNWFYNIFDFAGNQVTTANNTLTIDTVYPDYIFSSPVANTFYNNASVLFNVSTTSAPNASIIPNIDNSLVSWYRMDEISGTNVYDYMGRNNGTAINGAAQVTNGKFGDAFVTDEGKYVGNINGTMLNGVTAFTISTWVNPIALTGNWAGIVSKYIGDSNTVALQSHVDGKIFIDIDNGDVSYGSTVAGTVVPGNWYHLVLVYNGSGAINADRAKLYVNGTNTALSYSGTISSTTPTNAATITIGSLATLANHYFNGSIDDVMIFNRSLSSDEILSLYNATAYSHYETLGANANHTFNSYIQDFSGNINTTGAITFTVDTSQPNVSLLTPANNTFTNQTENINLTANLTDNIGIKNATLNIINTTDNSVTQTLIDVTSGSVQQTVGVVVSLVEGIYNWFINIFDLAGNQYNSQNSTLIIDTTYPLIEFDSSSPINETGTPDVFNLTILINETNIANVTLYFNSTNYYFDFTNNASYFTLVSGNQYNFSVEKGPLGNIEQIYYNLTVTDKAGNSNSTETRLIRGNTPPSLTSLSQTPSDNATLDPLVEVFVNATLLDTQSNFATAWLEWKNSTQDWAEANRTPMTTNGSTDFVFVNASFVLPGYEDNVQYRIFTNDSVGSSANLSIYNISNYWDCSWTATSDLGGKAGYSETGLLGYLIVNNTGDSSYADGCTLTFKSQHNLESGKIYLNSAAKSTIYSLTPGAIKNISTSYVFGTDMKSDSYIITTSETSEVTSVYQINTTGVAVTNQRGPYLYQSISPYSAPVYIKPEIFSITSYISNLMGSDVYNESNTAFNVSYDWEISPVFTNATGNLTGLFENMSDSNEYALDLGINATDWQTIRQGVYSFTLNSFGKDFNGDLINDTNNNSNFTSSINISFLCYQVSDGFDAKGCWPLDPDTVYCGNGKIDSSINETCSSCPEDAGVCPTVVSTGGSGGGGGGGGGNEFAKSEATFELVRGEKQEFILTLENKLDIAKKNITIKVSGDNSEYVSFDPEVIKYIGPNSAVNITVKITAPSYFAADRHLLRFDFAGDTIVNSTSVRFSEQKFVTLRILDISRTEINKMMNSSTQIISEMNSSGFIIRGVEDLYTQMQTNYENYSFADLKTNYAQLDLIYKSALESNKSIEEVGLDIADAEKRGLTVSETKKLLFLAEIMFKRGDYVLAAEKLKEAKLTFALETKGEFKLLYAIKNNPGESAGILVSAFLIAIGSSYVVRLRLLKRKLRVLAEEEQLLLQLMKVIQRDCFEGGKMAVEEYNEAMLQYERRLGEVIQERIRSETLLANLMRVNGSKNALAQEKARLISLIRTAQEDYLNKGKIETRVYENMLKTYGSRLSKIEEERVFSEAQEAIRKVTGWRFFRKR